MRSSTTLLISAFAAAVSAQNAFLNSVYTGIAAGTPFNITWSPTTTGTVSLILVDGSSSDLQPVATIAASIANDGYYVWTPASTLVEASDYALEIVDDANANIYNYSPQFSIDSTNTASASSASGSATSAATSGVSSATGSTSAAASSTGTKSSAATTTLSTATSTQSSAATSSSASSAATTTSASKAAAATGMAVSAGMLGLVGMAMMAM